MTADRAAKFLAETYLREGVAWGDTRLLSLSLHHNYGISFSLCVDFPSAGLCLSVLGAALMGILCLKGTWRHLGIGVWFLWGGATGNLIDRLAYGYVIDWLYVGVYVNLADVWLCAGSAASLFHLARKRP